MMVAQHATTMDVKPDWKNISEANVEGIVARLTEVIRKETLEHPKGLPRSFAPPGFEPPLPRGAPELSKKREAPAQDACPSKKPKFAVPDDYGKLLTDLENYIRTGRSSASSASVAPVQQLQPATGAASNSRGTQWADASASQQQQQQQQQLDEAFQQFERQVQQQPEQPQQQQQQQQWQRHQQQQQPQQ